MSAPSGLGDIFSCIKSSEELFLKKKRKLDDALAAISQERQRQAALHLEVTQRAAELERLQAQAAGLLTQLRLEERMADCLQKGLQTQQRALDSSKKDLDAATEEAEEAVTALEQLATSTHEAIRLDGGRFMEGANRHRRLLQELQLEDAALRCEVVLREDLLRDVLRMRCSAVAALRQLQRALLRRQQLLRARRSRQQQFKEQQHAKEKQQQQQEIQRLEAEALSVEDECLCLESLAAALRHELTRLNGASQTHRDRKEEAIRLCSVQPFVPASHLLHSSSRDHTKVDVLPVSGVAVPTGPSAGSLEGQACGRGPVTCTAEAVAVASPEKVVGKRSTKAGDAGGNTTVGDVRSSMQSSTSQGYTIPSSSASYGKLDSGPVINPSDSMGPTVKDPHQRDEGADPWGDRDWDDVLSITLVPEEQVAQVEQQLAILEEQLVQGQTQAKIFVQSSRDTINCDVVLRDPNAATHHVGRQHISGVGSHTYNSAASSSSVGTTNSVNRNCDYQNQNETVANQQQVGHCGNLDASCSEIKDVSTPSKRLASAMRSQEAAVNAVERMASNKGMNSQFNFKSMSTSSVSVRDSTTFSCPGPTSCSTNTVSGRQASVASSNNVLNKSDTGSVSSFYNSNSKNITHNPGLKVPQSSGNTQPKTVRFKFQKTSMIQLRPVKDCTATPSSGISTTATGSLNASENVLWSECRTKSHAPPKNISLAPVRPSSNQGNIKPLSQYNFQYRASDPQEINSRNVPGAVNPPGYSTGTGNIPCGANNSSSVNQNQFSNLKECNRSFTSTAPFPPQHAPVVNQSNRPLVNRIFSASPIRQSSTLFQSVNAARPQYRSSVASAQVYGSNNLRNSSTSGSACQTAAASPIGQYNTPFPSINAARPRYRSSVGSAQMYDSTTSRQASASGTAVYAPNQVNDNTCNIPLPEPVTFTRDSFQNVEMPSQDSVPCTRRGVRRGRGGRGVGRGSSESRCNGAKRLQFSTQTEVRDGSW